MTGLVRRRGKAAQFWNITLPDQDLIQDGFEGRAQGTRGGRSFPLVLDNTEVYPFPPGIIFSVSCTASLIICHISCILSSTFNPILNQDMCPLLNKLDIDILSFPQLFFEIAIRVFDYNEDFSQNMLLDFPVTYAVPFQVLCVFEKSVDTPDHFFEKCIDHLLQMNQVVSRSSNRIKGSEPFLPQEQTSTRNLRG